MRGQYGVEALGGLAVPDRWHTEDKQNGGVEEGKWYRAGRIGGGHNEAGGVGGWAERRGLAWMGGRNGAHGNDGWAVRGGGSGRVGGTGLVAGLRGQAVRRWWLEGWGRRRRGRGEGQQEATSVMGRWVAQH